MARKIRLTEAQKAELHAFGCGSCSRLYADYPPHIKLLELGFISRTTESGDWGLTPEGVSYLNGAHK